MTPSFIRSVSATGAVALVAALAPACSTAEAKTKTNNSSPEPVLHAAVVQVGTESVPHYLTLTGSLRGNREARVAADTTGKVVATYAERGEFVSGGHPVARIDARTAALASMEANALVQSARVDENQAKQDCERDERLFAENAIPRIEHERMLATCSSRTWSTAVASSRAGLANKSLGDTVVRAPFSGVVGERLVNVGEYVQPGTAVATVVELDTLKLELSVPESSIAAVHEGQTLDFEVATFPGEHFHGTIRRLGASLQLPTRSLVVEASVPNPDRRLYPGMFVTARVQIDSVPAPVVPVEALVGSERSRHLFVVHDKRVEERVVLVGESLGERIAISSGIEAGEWIVSRVTPETRDGSLVE